MEQKKSNKKLIAVFAVILAVLVAGALAVFFITRPDTADGSKEITFKVVYADKKEDSFDIKTDAQYLADALLEKNLIEESEYQSGFYTVINGVKADWSDNESWWCITKDGVMTEAGMNETVINDGDKFEATYTSGSAD